MIHNALNSTLIARSGDHTALQLESRPWPTMNRPVRFVGELPDLTVYDLHLGLGSRHTVLNPDADARELRLRDLARYPLLGVVWRFVFLVTDRRRRQRLQHTRFTRRLVDR